MPGFSANISLLFRELPLLERFAAARAAGFGGVEIQIPYEFAPQVLAAAARAADIPVILINAPMGSEPGSLGLACRPEHAQLFRSEMLRAAEYASVLQVPCVNVLAGRMTTHAGEPAAPAGEGATHAGEPAAPAGEGATRAGQVATHEQAHTLERLAENLSHAAGVLQDCGARALLEVVNPIDAPGYCVPDFELAARVLAACDARVGLQFDIYHAARLGLDPVAQFQHLLPRIAHVQFADCPGRHEPGTGTLDWARILRAIAASGYRGWLGAEYHPLHGTVAGLSWLGALRTEAQG